MWMSGLHTEKQWKGKPRMQVSERSGIPTIQPSAIPETVEPFSDSNYCLYSLCLTPGNIPADSYAHCDAQNHNLHWQGSIYLCSLTLRVIISSSEYIIFILGIVSHRY